MAFLDFLTTARLVKARKTADAARDRRDWATALLHYKIATSIDPRSVAIHVQAGNMAKELGDYVQAQLLYISAVRLTGIDDIHLQMGHLAKLRGQMAEALWYYSMAADENPANGDAEMERDRLQEK
ncbi:hypothetical protein IMSHALPRED_004616 [Imshaugia aleurites]|uniref:Tetratricopeptide repeat protein n=1 Tax=Imshaugia aleurites TaxID=172621 RepID=A0A8H3J8S3_9LECA|nr:hypothetical protein IMSHALPRED_004616 [Imshaugia aleurites]